MTFQESVIINTEAIETKHTKKRKAAAAATAAAAEQAAQASANVSDSLTYLTTEKVYHTTPARKHGAKSMLSYLNAGVKIFKEFHFKRIEWKR